jgi:hypothetical protein
MATGMRESKRIKPDERISFPLSRWERDLILERTFIDPELENRLRVALASGSKLVTTLTLNDGTGRKFGRRGESLR